VKNAPATGEADGLNFGSTSRLIESTTSSAVSVAGHGPVRIDELHPGPELERVRLAVGRDGRQVCGEEWDELRAAVVT
jgi:hypothetical protein